MPINKIFDTNVSATSVNTYVFSLVWSRDGVCMLNMLRGKTIGDWHKIITQSINDNDDEISVKLGTFRTGTELIIEFSVIGLTDVANAAILITNRDTGESRKMKPPGDGVTKNIIKAEPWIETFVFNAF